MSIENHKIKRNQELNRDLMKRWGFSPPESTEEVVTTEVDVEKQEPVVESSEAVRSLIIEAAEEAGVRFEENEIDEIIGEMIEEGFFDRLRAGSVGRKAAKADAERIKLTGQAKGMTDIYVKKLEDFSHWLGERCCQDELRPCFRRFGNESNKECLRPPQDNGIKTGNDGYRGGGLGQD